MPADVGVTDGSDDVDLKARIEHQAHALFSGKAGKGGASEIVRMIGRRADYVAKRKVERARNTVQAASRR